MTEDFAVQRSRLMLEGNRLRAKAHEHDMANRLGAAIPLWDRADEIDIQYRDLLPEVTVARCPHTDLVVRWPMDVVGLDAWFWEYESATRRTPKAQPSTWLAMTGAMRLTEPVEHPPFTVVPGPDVPFVVPRILEAPGVRAVIAEVPVGAHTGWAISYFGPKPENTKLVNLWGTDTYPVYRDGVWAGWNRDIPAVAHYDFELTPWLRSGALQWIAPGDESASLRQGPDDCPYVDLPGRRMITVLADGEVQHLATLPD